MKYFFVSAVNQIKNGSSSVSQHLLLSRKDLFFGAKEIHSLCVDAIIEKRPDFKIEDISPTQILFFKELTKEEFEYYNNN